MAAFTDSPEKKTLLIVDDTIPNRLLLRQALSGDYEILEAGGRAGRAGNFARRARGLPDNPGHPDARAGRLRRTGGAAGGQGAE